MCFSFVSRFTLAIWKITQFWLGPWRFRARLFSFLSCWQHNPKQLTQIVPSPWDHYFCVLPLCSNSSPSPSFSFCPFPPSNFFLLFWLKYSFHTVACTDVRCTIQMYNLVSAVTCVTHTLFKVQNTTITLDSCLCSLQVYPNCPPPKPNNQCFGFFQYSLALLVLEIFLGVGTRNLDKWNDLVCICLITFLKFINIVICVSNLFYC